MFAILAGNQGLHGHQSEADVAANLQRAQPLVISLGTDLVRERIIDCN